MAEIDAATIAENVTKPKSASADGVSATQFSVAEQIEAARFNAVAGRSLDPSRCLRKYKIVPSGGRV